VGATDRAQKGIGFTATKPLSEGINDLIAWRSYADHHEGVA
jgi:hypothetical protein